MLGSLSLDASGLLVGDSSCAFEWRGGGGGCAVDANSGGCGGSGGGGDSAIGANSGGCDTGSGCRGAGKPPRQVLEGRLAEQLAAISVTLVLTEAPPTPPTPDTADGKPGAARRAAGGGGAAAGPPRAPAEAGAAAGAPPAPGRLLPPDMAARLNPIVVSVYKAKRLPAAPAAAEQLDARCEPASLRVRWPPGAPPRKQRAAAAGAWAPQTRGAVGGLGAARAAAFARPMVLIGGDAGGRAGLRQLLLEFPLALEIHDRRVVPEPPEFPIPASSEVGGAVGGDAGAAAGAAPPAAAAPGGAEDAGEVFAAAVVPVGELARGRARLEFEAALLPRSTIRGAAGRDWRSRPGAYAEVGPAAHIVGLCCDL